MLRTRPQPEPKAQAAARQRSFAARTGREALAAAQHRSFAARSGSEALVEEDAERMQDLKAIFVATYENFGRFNKRGNKTGVRNTKMNPRVL
jgi:hypothetical protein